MTSIAVCSEMSHWPRGSDFFLLCSQARMRMGRGGLKDSIFPVPLPAMILLPMITTAHPTFWYFSLKVLSLPTHVLLNDCFNFCFLPSFRWGNFLSSAAACFETTVFGCFLPELLDFAEKFSSPLNLYSFYYFPLKSCIGNQFCNVYTASNGPTHQESYSHWQGQ